MIIKLACEFSGSSLVGLFPHFLQTATLLALRQKFRFLADFNSLLKKPDLNSLSFCHIFLSLEFTYLIGQLGKL